MVSDLFNIRAEDFGPVRLHHTDAFNFQLAEQLKEFDRLYEQDGGRIGSMGYFADRMTFAAVVCEGLFKEFHYNNDVIGDMTTRTEFNCQSISSTFQIETKTRFSDDMINRANDKLENPGLYAEIIVS